MQKTLLYGEPGAGKTSQYLNFQRKYGPGLVISCESGLRSLASASIDYIELTSWDGPHDPENGIYSWIGTRKMISDPAFKSLGYKWLGLDSLTELADMCLEFTDAEVTAAVKPGKEKNGFEVYANYGARMVGSVKFFRDLPYQILITALIKEDRDENGGNSYRPMIKGSAAATQIPGIIDNVIALVRRAQVVNEGGKEVTRVARYLVCDEYKGYLAKVRDPNRRIAAIEKCDDITVLFDRMSEPKTAFEAHTETLKAA